MMNGNISHYGTEPKGLTYSGQVTPVTHGTDPETGEVTYIPGTPLADQPWLAWSQTNDVTGRSGTRPPG